MMSSKMIREKKLEIFEDNCESDSLILPRPFEKKNNELYLFFCDIHSFKNVCSTKRNLHKLVIIGQLGFKNLNGISNLTNLKELWVVECLVKDISDLKKCYKLEKLYLYSNDIDEVPDMSNNSDLRLLSLSGNNISKLQNFQSMPKLEELYLANNDIKRIGHSLKHNSNLYFINVAGNFLYQLKDIKNLSSLPRLQSIAFADSLYGECPLVYLSNYRHFVINYLPGLKKLDYYPINAEERSYVTEFFKSKIMFYNMLWHKYLRCLIKTLKDHAEDNRRKLSESREEIYSAKLEHLRIAASTDICVESKDFEKLQEIIFRLDTNDTLEEKWIENAEIYSRILQQQLSLTVQHSGNIKFAEYKPGDTGKTLVKICQDICNNSLCSTLREDLGIIGVHVHRVTKVINNETDVLRYLKYFSESKNDESQTESVFTFLVKPVGVVELENWPFHVFEEEFFCTTELITSDCLAAADAPWMKSISTNNSSSATPMHLFNERRIATIIQLPASFLSIKVEKRDIFHAMHSNHDEEKCQCLSLVDPTQAKPVFAIEYEYVFENEPKKSEHEEYSTKVARNNLPKSWTRLNFENLKFFLHLTELEVHKLRIINLSGQGICTVDLETPLPNLRELNLSCNKLTALPDSEMLKCIRKLDLSFNDIRSFEIRTSLPLLESFDVAWNRLIEFNTSLKVLKTFVPNLTTLNVEHNPFTDVIKTESMFLLANVTLPSIKYFNGKLLKNRSKSVHQDRWVIEMFEMADLAKYKIIQQATTAVITEAGEALTSPLSISKDQLENVQYINLSNNRLNTAEFITEFNQLRELYLINNLFIKISFNKSANQLTKLSLCGNFITTMDGLKQENLPVLNYLDLCNNLITSLKPMGAFHSLIEFYCSDNKICKLSGIHNLKNWHGLKIIDLSNNPIDSARMWKMFIIFHVPKIEYVDGECVTAADTLAANHTFGGSLNKDMITSMPHVLGDLTHIRELSIVNCAIRKVDLTADLLPNLESLDLRKNQLTTLWGLHCLKKLQTLCLSYNKINTSSPTIHRKDVLTPGCFFPRLNSLFLDHNSIRSLMDFNFKNMPALKHLYLQHNELHDVSGVQNCVSLKILVLDDNKIQIITEEDFHTENSLKTLLLENNRIKFLFFTKRLSNIEKLFISYNKITDKDQLNYLGTLKNLKEITILGNPFCKRTNHYKLAMRALTTLTHIDGHSMILK